MRVEKRENTSGGQITEVVLGRRKRGQQHPLTIAMETKKERAADTNCSSNQPSLAPLDPGVTDAGLHN